MIASCSVSGVGNWVREGTCANAWILLMACWWGLFGTGCIGGTSLDDDDAPSVSGEKWGWEVPGILNRSDEYSGLPVEIDLREDEDDAGGFWSICWDSTLVEKSSGNKLLSVVWMSTCTKKIIWEINIQNTILIHLLVYEVVIKYVNIW